MAINEWSEEDRPREKFMSKGAAALSAAELLAILIGSGVPGENAVELMRRVLQDCSGSLRNLGMRSVHELCRYKGIGEAKAITIAAACELGNRRLNEQADSTSLNSSQAIYSRARERFMDLDHEEAWVMLLNQNLRLIDFKRIGVGGLTSTSVDVRIVLREAIVQRATHLVLCHNHPSGDCTPSTADDRLTQKIAKAAGLIDIRLIDHIVIGEGNYFSYADEGRMPI